MKPLQHVHAVLLTALLAFQAAREDLSEYEEDLPLAKKQSVVVCF
jgi:hypothetical protein